MQCMCHRTGFRLAIDDIAEAQAATLTSADIDRWERKAGRLDQGAG